MVSRDQMRRPLPTGMPIAERDFYLELRRLIDIGGLSVRALQEVAWEAVTHHPLSGVRDSGAAVGAK